VPEKVQGGFIFMGFAPVTPLPRAGRAPVNRYQTAYDTITLPEVVVTTTGPVVAEFTVDAGYYAVKAVTPTVGLAVRYNGVRYNFGGTPEPNPYAVSYSGQTLGPEAVFEYWNTVSSTIPAVAVTISTRTGNNQTAEAELTVRKGFPLSFPIANG
jgi:hypothetical protein